MKCCSSGILTKGCDDPGALEYTSDAILAAGDDELAGGKGMGDDPKCTAGRRIEGEERAED